MCTGVVRHDDWGRLRAAAQQMNGRAVADASDVERTAMRLATYILAGTIEITHTSDVFGAADGAEWLLIDFMDGLEDVCIPIGANASPQKVHAEVVVVPVTMSL